jgi:hypothetical protein
MWTKQLLLMLGFVASLLTSLLTFQMAEVAVSRKLFRGNFVAHRPAASHTSTGTKRGRTTAGLHFDRRNSTLTSRVSCHVERCLFAVGARFTLPNAPERVTLAS